MKADVLSALTVVGPMTTQELMPYLGLAQSSVADSLRILRKDGLVCIVSWNPPEWTGGHAPVFGIGSVDTPRPKRKSNAAVGRDMRKRRGKLMWRLESKKPASPWDGLIK